MCIWYSISICMDVGSAGYNTTWFALRQAQRYIRPKGNTMAYCTWIGYKLLWEQNQRNCINKEVNEPSFVWYTSIHPTELFIFALSISVTIGKRLQTITLKWCAWIMYHTIICVRTIKALNSIESTKHPRQNRWLLTIIIQSSYISWWQWWLFDEDWNTVFICLQITRCVFSSATKARQFSSFSNIKLTICL